MSNRALSLATAITLMVISGAGAIDAIIDDRNGPAALFVIVGLGIAMMSRTTSNDQSVTLRRDLSSWLDRVSPVTGETPDELANRAVSRLRAGFSDLPSESQ